MNRTFPKLLMIIALFGLSLASGIAAKQEYYAGKPLGKMAFSLLSDHRILSECLAGLTTLQGRLLAPENRRLALENCDMISQNILRSSSNDGYAWFVLAYANFHLGNKALFNAALGKSYDFARYETWLSRLRIPLAEQAFLSLSKANTINHIDDLNLTLHSNTGFSSLVALYIRNPGFRPRISRLLTNQPKANQTRFIAALRRGISE